MNSPKTIVEVILSFSQRKISTPAVQFKRDNEWQKKTWSEYFIDIEAVASSLMAGTFPEGTRVALMSNTRYEWALVDAATLSLGGVVVPVYPNSTDSELTHILNHSEVEILFIENDKLFRRWKEIQKNCPRIREIICFENVKADSTPRVKWKDFLDRGKKWKTTNSSKFEERARQVQSHHLATLIYTSGTTGIPKGVQLTHEQIVSEVSEAFPLCGVTSNDVSLSFLPYAHVLGRIELWGHQWMGFTLAFAEGIDHLQKNLQEVKPTLLIAVPRIFEKFHSSLWAQLENQPVRSRLFDWALDVGLKLGKLKMMKTQFPISLLGEWVLAERLVLRKVKEAFGGRLRFCISGGAPLNSSIAEFFHACGVLILEGYGLTETTGAICVNTPFNYKFGSVGRPIGDVKIKIAEDGEILIHSRKVFKAYEKDEESTKVAFTEGWYHTGDVGEILPGGDLKITDRKKDLIKTAGGKYVAPQKLEALVKNSPLISQVLIHGDQRKYVTALFTLDPEQMKRLAREHQWSFKEWAEITQRPEVYELVRRAVAEVNKALASFETIKRFVILPNEFTVENGELTPSLKVKRKVLDQKFKAVLDSLYD